MNDPRDPAEYEASYTTDKVRALASFWSAVSYYIAAKDDAAEMRKRFWAVQYAMTTPLSRECSQAERARRCGCVRYSFQIRIADAKLAVKSLVS
jgi:hypothetical protein